MNLRRGLRLGRRCQVIFTGAGGKTSAMFRLARAFEPPVIVTTSTHLGTWQIGLADQHKIVYDSHHLFEKIISASGVSLFTGPVGDDQRVSGLPDEVLRELFERAGQLEIPVLLEADGSRQRPLKAPGEHEPAIPPWMKDSPEGIQRLFVVVAGLNGISKPLDAESVHRPEQFGALAGTQQRQIITPEMLSRVIAHPQGGVKNIPPLGDKVLLLNQAESAQNIEAGKWIAENLTGIFDAVLISSLIAEAEAEVILVYDRIVGVILAGGSSSRFGQPKMLLDWQGKPLISHVVELALRGGMQDVVVVTGAVDEPIRKALSAYPVKIVNNARWQEGQSTSIQAGLNVFPGSRVGAALFLLADQPFVTPTLIQALINFHRGTLAPVIAPRAARRRSNPVLFDQVTFPDLQKIHGDTGGRVIFEQFPPVLVDWPDARLIEELDTPEDYERLSRKS